MLSSDIASYIKMHQSSFDELNQNLHLSDIEIEEQFVNIKKIIHQNEQCKNLPVDRCINSNFLHLSLIRNEDHGIDITLVKCPKRAIKDLIIADDYKVNAQGKEMTMWWGALFDQFQNGHKSFSKYKKQADSNTNPKNNSINLLALLYDYFFKLKQSKKPEALKGIYLYGDYGIGKSLFMHFYCDQMHKLGLSTAFVSANVLLKNAKKSIEDVDKTKFSKYQKDLRKADVLVLDDLGAEKGSEWFYSEILFGILDYRMNNKKLTFFTSNFSIEDLAEKIQTKGNLTKIDAGRIIERVRSLVNNQAFQLLSINHRYEKKH